MVPSRVLTPLALGDLTTLQVSFILSFFGFFAFLTVDFLKHVYHPGSGSWLHPLLFFGVLAADLAPFLAHYSGSCLLKLSKA